MKGTVGGILLAALGLLAGAGCASRGTVALDGLRAEARRHEARADSLERLTRASDTVYVHQRDTLRLTVATYDTVRARDTLVRNDTVFVPRAVADRAVEACRATVTTCEERVRLRDAAHAAERDAHRVQLAAVKAQVPTTRDRARTALAYLGLGALLALGALAVLRR